MRLRRALSSRPVQWVVVAALAASSVVVGLGGGRLADPQSWPTVPVANDDLAVGTTVSTSDVELVRLPPDLLPEAAPAEDPVGRVVAERILAGEVLAEERLGGTGAEALLEEGERSISVAPEPPWPTLEVGDLVDVIVALETYPSSVSTPGSDDALPATVVTSAVEVIGVDEAGIALAVPAEAAPRVAAAAAVGRISLAVVGPLG